MGGVYSCNFAFSGKPYLENKSHREFKFLNLRFLTFSCSDP